MTSPLVDIGVNLSHASFAADRDAVIDRALRASVATLIITGTSEPQSRAALSLARTRPSVLYATAGVHPHHAKECNERTLPALRSLAAAPEVVAIGECGLDYNRNFSPRPVQEKWFAAQLELAADLGLPAFLHERDAHDRFLAILREQRARLAGAVVHCFTGKAAELDAYLDLGLSIGITGWICDERRGKHLGELVRRIPADRLMIETDAPFLAPRDITPRLSRNEPCYLPHVLRAVAKAAGRSEDTIARETTDAAYRFFGKMQRPAANTASS
jgi:TatD DNase family protein